MFHKPKTLYPHVIHREQMKELTASLLYEGMRDKVGLNHVRISLRGVRMVGPGVYIPAAESEIVPDTKKTLDTYAVAAYEWYSVEGTYDAPKFDPSEKLTREQFLMELLDRLDGFVEAVKYSPALHERIAEEIDIASHYVRGAFDLGELRDMSYLEGQFANPQL